MVISSCITACTWVRRSCTCFTLSFTWRTNQNTGVKKSWLTSANVRISIDIYKISIRLNRARITFIITNFSTRLARKMALSTILCDRVYLSSDCALTCASARIRYQIQILITISTKGAGTRTGDTWRITWSTIYVISILKISG